MAGDLGDLYARLRLDTSSLDAATAKVSGLGSLLSGGLLGATAAVAGVGVAAGAMAANFQQATDRMAAQAGITAAAAAKIGDAFLGTGGQVTFSAQQIVTAYGPVSGQLGLVQGKALDAAQALQFMRTAMNLAEATGKPLADTTSALANVIQTFQFRVSDAAKASDELFNASRALNIPVAELVPTIDALHAKLGPLGGNLAQLSTLMVDLAEHGLTGSRALRLVSTATDTLIANYQKVPGEVDKAKASLDAATAAYDKVAGSSRSSAAAIDAARQKMEDAQGKVDALSNGLGGLNLTVFNSQGQFVGFGSIIEQLAPKLAKMSEQQRITTENALFGKGAFDRLDATLLGGLPAWDKAQAAATKLGTAQQGAQTATENLKGQWDKTWGAIQDALVQVGLKLLPPFEAGLTFVAQHLQQILAVAGPLALTMAAIWTVDHIYKWGLAAEQAIVKVAGLLTGSGGLQSILGKLFPNITGSVGGATASTAAGDVAKGMRVWGGPVDVVVTNPVATGAPAATATAAGAAATGAGGAATAAGDAALASARAATTGLRGLLSAAAVSLAFQADITSEFSKAASSAKTYSGDWANLQAAFHDSGTKQQADLQFLALALQAQGVSANGVKGLMSALETLYRDHLVNSSSQVGQVTGYWKQYVAASGGIPPTVNQIEAFLLVSQKAASLASSHGQDFASLVGSLARSTGTSINQILSDYSLTAAAASSALALQQQITGILARGVSLASGREAAIGSIRGLQHGGVGNWGAGTPVVLHDVEAVVPRSLAPPWLWDAMLQALGGKAPLLPAPALPVPAPLPAPAVPVRVVLPAPVLPERAVLPAPVLPPPAILPAPALPERVVLPAPVLPPPSVLPAPLLPARAALPAPTLPSPAALPAPTLPAPAVLPAPVLPAAAVLPAPVLPARAALPAPALPPTATLPAPVLPPASVLPSPALPARATLPAPALPPPATLPAPRLPAPAALPAPLLPAAAKAEPEPAKALAPVWLWDAVLTALAKVAAPSAPAVSPALTSAAIPKLTVAPALGGATAPAAAVPPPWLWDTVLAALTKAAVPPVPPVATSPPPALPAPPALPTLRAEPVGELKSLAPPWLWDAMLAALARGAPLSPAPAPLVAPAAPAVAAVPPVHAAGHTFNLAFNGANMSAADVAGELAWLARTAL